MPAQPAAVLQSGPVAVASGAVPCPVAMPATARLLLRLAALLAGPARARRPGLPVEGRQGRHPLLRFAAAGPAALPEPRARRHATRCRRSQAGRAKPAEDPQLRHRAHEPGQPQERQAPVGLDANGDGKPDAEMSAEERAAPGRSWPKPTLKTYCSRRPPLSLADAADLGHRRRRRCSAWRGWRGGARATRASRPSAVERERQAARRRPRPRARSLYRWRDAHGVLQITEQPPKGRKYERIDREPMAASKSTATAAAMSRRSGSRLAARPRPKCPHGVAGLPAQRMAKCPLPFASKPRRCACRSSTSTPARKPPPTPRSSATS